METKVKKIPDWSKVAEIELLYKSTIKRSERIKINGSKDAYHLLRNHWDENTLELKESFHVVLLNAARVNGIYEASVGGIDLVGIDIRLIFTAALKTKSTAIVLAHNHPSGDKLPSKPDERITEQIKKAGQLLNIRVLDHIILTKTDYFSFADAGML